LIRKTQMTTWRRVIAHLDADAVLRGLWNKPRPPPAEYAVCGSAERNVEDRHRTPTRPGSRRVHATAHRAGPQARPSSSCSGRFEKYEGFSGDVSLLMTLLQTLEQTSSEEGYFDLSGAREDSSRGGRSLYPSPVHWPVLEHLGERGDWP